MDLIENIIGIDIGGTKCAVSLGGLSNTGELNIIDKAGFPTEVTRGPQYEIDRICESILTVTGRNSLAIDKIKAIGISCGGPLDSRRGIILSPPNLISWDNIHIVDIIEKRFGIKTRLQNDANACALAEWRYGAGRGFGNVIFLTFGTGMGAGLILDGKLYSGTNDMAGEVGHIRLAENGPVGYAKSGSFEGFCSGGGIAQLARIKVLEKLQMGEEVSFCSSIERLDQLNAKIIADFAKAGDKLAAEIYSICGHYLGKGLAVLIDILNPEVIVIGSIFTRCRDLLWPEAERVLRSESLKYSAEVCKVVPAFLGESIGDYAALSVAAYC